MIAFWQATPCLTFGKLRLVLFHRSSYVLSIFFGKLRLVLFHRSSYVLSIFGKLRLVLFLTSYVLSYFIEVDSFKTFAYDCSFSGLAVPALWVSCSGALGIDCCGITEKKLRIQESQMRWDEQTRRRSRRRKRRCRSCQAWCEIWRDCGTEYIVSPPGKHVFCNAGP